MFFKRSFLHKRLAADGAGEGLVVVVRLQVDFLAHAIREHLVTEMTRACFHSTALARQMIAQQVEP